MEFQQINEDQQMITIYKNAKQKEQIKPKMQSLMLTQKINPRKHSELVILPQQTHKSKYTNINRLSNIKISNQKQLSPHLSPQACQFKTKNSNSNLNQNSSFSTHNESFNIIDIENIKVQSIHDTKKLFGQQIQKGQRYMKGTQRNRQQLNSLQIKNILDSKNKKVKLNYQKSSMIANISKNNQSTMQKISQQINESNLKMNQNTKDYRQIAKDNFIQMQQKKLDELSKSTSQGNQSNLSQIPQSRNSQLRDFKGNKISDFGNINEFFKSQSLCQGYYSLFKENSKNSQANQKYVSRQNRKFQSLLNMHSDTLTKQIIVNDINYLYSVNEQFQEYMRNQFDIQNKGKRNTRKRKNFVRTMNYCEYYPKDEDQNKRDNKIIENDNMNQVDVIRQSKIVEMDIEEQLYLEQQLKDTSKKQQMICRQFDQQMKVEYSKMKQNQEELKQLTEEDILYIKDCISKYNRQELFLKVDSLLVKMKFFQIPFGVKRSKLYHNCVFDKLEKDQIICRQDEEKEKDYIYLIMKGQISLVKMIDGHKQIIVSFNSSQYFDDQQIFKQITKEYSNTEKEIFIKQINPFHTDTKFIKNRNDKFYLKKSNDEFHNQRARFQFFIQAQVQTYILRIEKEKFEQIYFDVKTDSQAQYMIKMLQNQKFFISFNNVQLMPIINYIEIRKYQLNQVILHQGGITEGLYLIIKGKVRRAIVQQQNVNQTVQKKKQISNFTTNTKNPNNDRQSNIYLKKQIDSRVSEKHDLSKLDKQYSYQRLTPQSQNSNINMLYLQDLGNLEEGWIFGQKTILQELNKKAKIILFPSEITLISESNNTELFFIHRDYMKYMPESIQDYFLLNLGNYKDFDDIEIEGIKYISHNWNNYKGQYIKQVKLENTNEKYTQDQIYKRF